MLYCVKCQNGLPDGTIFCDYCGNEIADASSVTTAATLPDLRQRGHSGRANDTVRRTSVNAAAAALPNAPQATDESVDGISERLTSPAPFPSLPPAQAPRPLPMNGGNSVAPPEQRLSLDAEGPAVHDQRSNSARLIQLQLGREVFELSGQSSYLVGRHDPDQQLFPDVDLHDWDGAAVGVSRRHFMIRVIGNIVSIEDLESRNSTILNGYRLFPHQQYPLVDNDEVRIGDITLLVRIVSIN